MDSVLDAATSAYVAVDHEGRIAGWNLAAELMFGWPREEAHGRGFRETLLVSPGSGSGDAVLDVFLGTGDDEQVDRRIELMTRHRDGHYIPTQVTIAPLRVGRSPQYSLFLDDISERRDAVGQLERARLEVAERLVLAAEFRDHATGDHTERVGRMAAEVAAELALPATDIALIARAAPLHDVGKIAIPDAILLKPGRLTDEEREYMETHTLVGGRLLAGAQFPLLEMAHDIALYHHERWDGAGYPLGMAGDEIPLPARIVAVVDAFDALTNDRPYQRARPAEEALEVLRSERGRQFDPAVVDAVLELWPRRLRGRAALREVGSPVAA